MSCSNIKPPFRIHCENRVNKALEYASRIAYSNTDTLQFSFDCAEKMRDVDCVFVEAGVAAGAQIIAMHHGAPKKIIYAFDSFQGIPLPSNRDDQMPGIKRLTTYEQSHLPNPGEQLLETTGATAVSEESFKTHLIAGGVNMDVIKVCPGWFEHTVPVFGQFSVRIGILRLDGDLYNSTYVCLKHLYHNVIKGGIVIIDDWELPGSRSAMEDYFNGVMPEMQFVSNIAYFVK